MCGYELRKEISEIKANHDMPSFGSIYPALKDMKKEGLIDSRKAGKKILYRINEKGKKAIKAQVKSGLKELTKKIGVYEKILKNDEDLFIFQIYCLFKNHKDRKKAKGVMNDCIKKLRDGQDAKK